MIPAAPSSPPHAGARALPSACGDYRLATADIALKQSVHGNRARQIVRDFVLGGGLDVRPFAAADYYRMGLSRKIPVSDVRLSRSEKLGLTTAHGEANRNVLLMLGVPETAIEFFSHANRNTQEEALALRSWAERTHARSLIVPIEIFSSRRVRWAFENVFEGSGIQLQVAALDADEYGLIDWWQHEQGLIAFQNEVLKYVYYRLKY
jgi:DUF218 domain